MLKINEQLLKVWVNTTLGETWVDKDQAPYWQRLFKRKENYPIGVVPFGGLVLTASVDVQKDRIEVEIVAWGKTARVGLLIIVFLMVTRPKPVLGSISLI